MEEQQIIGQKTEQTPSIVYDNEKFRNMILELVKDNDKLKSFARYIRTRLRDDWDIVIAITGEEGVGKSVDTILLGYLIDKGFDLRRNIAYLPSPTEIRKQFESLPRYSVLDIDEAVKSLHKYKWYEKLQQSLIEMYATERYKNKATFLLLPRFLDFTENFRNYRIKVWIHIIDRGYGIAYIKDNDKDNPDPWNFKPNTILKNKFFRNRKICEREINELIDAEKRTKNYLLDFQFPKLPEEIEEVYNQLKEESRHRPNEDDILLKENRVDKYINVAKKYILYLRKLNPKITETELSKELEISQPTVNRLLHDRIKV